MDHPYRAPLISRSETDIFCAGGAGCFGVPAEYCSESVPLLSVLPLRFLNLVGQELIAVLLNDGTCPKTNVQLLKPETIQGKVSISFSAAGISADIDRHRDVSRPDPGSTTDSQHHT